MRKIGDCCDGLAEEFLCASGSSVPMSCLRSGPRLALWGAARKYKLRNANICNANPSLHNENTIDTSICQYKYPQKDMCESIYNVILASANINALLAAANTNARQASVNTT